MHKAICFSGKVMRGEGIAGSTTGYPTLNIDRRTIKGRLPKKGVWSCWMTALDRRYPATLIIGVPYQRQKRQHGKVEVHVLHSTHLPHGTLLNVEVVALIRDLLPYTNLSALQKQIKRDLTKARTHLKLK